MPDNQCTTEQFSVRLISCPLGGKDPQNAHLRGHDKLDIANCDIKAKLWWPAFLPRQIAPLFAQKIVHTAPLQKQNICNIKQVIFGVLVAFMILFIYVY